MLIGIVSGGSMMETRHKQLIVFSSVYVIRVMVFFSFLFLFLFFFLFFFFFLLTDTIGIFSRCPWD